MRFDTLAIIVVNYGSSALLELNLVPLGRSLPGARIVVVDNATDAAERSRVIALAQRETWETVLPQSNVGFGVGMNLGVARAIALDVRTLLLLNPDAMIEADQVSLLLERSIRDPMTMLAPRILRPDGSVWFDGADLYLDDGRIRAAARRDRRSRLPVEAWLTGACLMLAADLWERVGGFASEYFLYWEDVDLSHRVISAGGAIAVCSDVIATHAEGGTQGDGLESAGKAKSSTYYYYNIRNRLLFAARNLSAADVRRWRRSAIPIAYEILLQGGRRQFLHPWGPVCAALKGMIAGSAIARRELHSRGRWVYTQRPRLRGE